MKDAPKRQAAGKKSQTNKGGRPSVYSEDIAVEICARISNGESLRKILKDDHMPVMSAIFRWLADERYATFREQYTHAREIQIEHMAEDIMEISDELPSMTAEGKYDSAAVQHQRLRVDSRKWLLSKLAPKKYGDKQTVEHEGGVTLNVVTGVSDDD